MSLHDVVPENSVGAIYGRFSTDHQERTMQIGSIEEMLKKYKWEAPLVYFDEGVSATKNKLAQRKELQRLMKDAEERKFSFVITYASDRLARNATEHRQIREKMATLGIPFILCNTEAVYDTGDLIGQIVQDGYTQYEVEQTRVRTRDTLRIKVKNGEWFGGTLPYGYTWDGNRQKYVLIPSERSVLKEIFHEYLRGMGFEEIAGSRTRKPLNGMKWTKERIRNIITNPFYAGYVAFRADPNSPNSILPRDRWTMSESASSKIEPLISLVEWEQCWNLFDQKRRGQIRPRSYTTSYHLKGILYCKHRDEKDKDVLVRMGNKNYVNKASNGKEYSGRKYICPSCKRKFDAKKIEKHVIDEVELLISRKSTDIEFEIEQRLDLEVRHLEKEIKTLQRSIDKYNVLIDRAGREMQKFGEWEDKDKAYKLRYVLQQYRIDAQKQIDDWNQAIVESKRRIGYIKSVETKADTWKQLCKEVGNPAANRRLLLYLIDRVEVDSDGSIDIVARINDEG